MSNQQFDGFSYGITYNTRPMMYNGYWYSIGQMEALRKCAGDYRVKWVAAPNSFNSAIEIAARDTAYFEFEVKPGSYLYGWNFTGDVDAYNFAIRIMDSGTGKLLENFQVSGSFFRSPTAGNNVGASIQVPPIVLLMQPKLVSGNGNLSVEMVNNSNAASKAQLALFFAEPRRPDVCLPGTAECGPSTR